MDAAKQTSRTKAERWTRMTLSRRVLLSDV
jgi:hypothetical protein